MPEPTLESSTRPVTDSQILHWGKAPSPETDSVPETKFLQGPLPRGLELWHTLSVMREMIHGFRKLSFVGPCVTVFGSARFDENHVFYKQARLIGRRLAENGFTIMTGGGPGIMEAANRGAKDVPGGSEVTLHAKKPTDVALLQSKAKDRAANFAQAVAAAPK